MPLRLGFLSRKQHYKGLRWLASCHSEEMTGTGLTRLFCQLRAREKVKQYQRRDLWQETNVCLKKASLLALEMICEVAMNHKAALFNNPRVQSGEKVCLVWKAKRLFACWYSSALPLHLFFSAVALETDLYARVSLVLPVYCKLLCHGRARARVSGLEGGGKGSSSRAVGEGRHSHFLRREKKRPRLTLWPVISTFTAAFLFIWSVCEDLRLF